MIYMLTFLIFAYLLILYNYYYLLVMTLQILTKCVLITIISCLLSLLFFDLQNLQTKIEVQAPSCISLLSNQNKMKYYVCALCYNFQAKNQNLVDEYLRFESSQQFALLGLEQDQHQTEMLSCSEYIQLLKYTSQNLKKMLLQQLQPSDFELQDFISTNQNWKNKGLFVKSQFHGELSQIYLTKKYTSFVAYYYDYQNQRSKVTILKDNIQNYNNFRYITKILTLGSLFGILLHIKLSSHQQIKLIFKSILQIINSVFILVIFFKESDTLLYHEIFKFQIIFWAICLNIFGVSKKIIMFGLLLLLIPNEQDYETLFRIIAYPVAICFYMGKYQHKQINCKKNFVVILLSIQLVVFSFHNFFKQGSFSFGFNMIRMVLIIMGHLMTIKKLDYFEVKQKKQKIKISQIHEDQQSQFVLYESKEENSQFSQNSSQEDQDVQIDMKSRYYKNKSQL